VLGSRPGLEILHPMALVLLGGVVSSALMALLVLPALYLHLAPAARYDVSEMDADYEMPVPAESDETDGYPPRHPAPDREPSS
jgi:hypothetical protein